MKYIDIHTHAFPDTLAERAIEGIAKVSGDIKPKTNGTVSDLIRAMDEGGVNASVIASIATKVPQFEAILNWSRSVMSGRIIPFASIHPEDGGFADKVDKIIASNIRGLKVHTFYQSHAVDEKIWFPLYDAAQEAGLPILFHSGFDVAFAALDLAHPWRFRKVTGNFPKLKIIMAHMGGWLAYKDFLKDMCGKKVMIDTSCSAGLCPIEVAKEILSRHGAENILFGTDCPWGGQKEHIRFVKDFCPDEKAQELIFYKNAERLLGITLTERE